MRQWWGDSMSFLTSQYTFVMSGEPSSAISRTTGFDRIMVKETRCRFRNKTQHVSVSLQPCSPRSVTAQFANKSITCLADWPTGWRAEAGHDSICTVCRRDNQVRIFGTKHRNKSVSGHVALQFWCSKRWNRVTLNYCFTLLQTDVHIIFTETLMPVKIWLKQT